MRADLDGLQEIEDADDEDQRGVLEQADVGVDDVRDGDLQRLRQDDQPHRLPIAEADRHRAFVLALRDRLQAGAHHLGHVGRGEQRDADQRAQQLVGRPGVGHEQRQHHARHEQHGDQRHAAHELDEDHREQPHRRHARAAAERQQDAERQRRRRCRPPPPRWSPECRPTAWSRPAAARSPGKPSSRMSEAIGMTTKK